MNEAMYRDAVRWMKCALMLALAASVLWFVVKTVHWPLTGDASLMHYVAMLMDRGRLPYRDIGDMNLPLSYAPSWMVGHLFGGGDLPWRTYDLALIAVAGAAMYLISRPYGAFPAVWAGCLFALIHGRDGPLQVGQRDLCAAVLLIVGVALLFGAMRGERSRMAAGFGVCAGAATAIKPTFAAFMLLAFAAYFAERNHASKAGIRLRYAVLGWSIPVAGCAAWLAAKGSLSAFGYALLVVGPYHAKVGHAPREFLLGNSVSPIVWLLAAWLPVRWAMWRRARTHDTGAAREPLERRLLLLAAAFGYLSYLVQQRAYPYHRYPFQVFLLLAMALDFTQALRGAGWVRWMGAAALAWGAMVFAPVSAVKAGRYEWRLQPFQSALATDLARVAAPRGLRSLDGRVQCLDSISGCVATLDRLQLAQSTGVMYDEFLFNPGGESVVDNARSGFLKDIERAPPLVFVVSESLFPAGPGEYRKLERWPAFGDWLDAHYALEVERGFTPPAREGGRPSAPSGYRIYVPK